MRLIDADKLNEMLREEVNNDITFKFIADSFISIINAMPTAYDVEKVVKELKNCRNGKNSPDICRSLSEIDVIDIVRRGGVE